MFNISLLLNGHYILEFYLAVTTKVFKKRNVQQNGGDSQTPTYQQDGK